MIRDCKRIVSAVLIFVLCISLGMTAYATETPQSGNKKELTEEEKKMQEELDKAYTVAALVLR